MAATQGTVAERLEISGYAESVADIREAAAAEQAAYAKWEAAFADEEVSPSDEYYDALEAWLDIYQPSRMPVAYAAMTELNELYKRFVNMGGNMPPNEFWRVRADCQAKMLLEPPAAKQRKTPQQLTAAGVRPAQIAYEYRILDEDGNADIRLVQAELAKPGSVLTKEHMAKLHEWDMEQLGFAVPKHANMAWQAAQVEKTYDSLEDLITQGVSVEQIVDIKSQQYGGEVDLWRIYVPTLASLMGVSLPANAQDAINAGGHELITAGMGEDLAAGIDLARNRAPVMPNDIEVAPEQPVADQKEAVRLLFESGAGVPEIAEQLGIPQSKVKKLLA